MTKQERKIVEKHLYEYKQIELNIEFLKNRLLDLEELKIEPSMNGINYENIKVSPTNKISDGLIEEQIRILDEIERINKKIKKQRGRKVIIEKALNNLSYRQKRVIEEIYINKNTIECVAEIMCVDPTTVSRNKKKALEFLKYTFIG